MKQLRQSKGLYFYTPEQYEKDVDILITFSALSHGQLIALENIINDNKSNEFSYQSCKLAIKSIIDNQGAEVPFTALSPTVLAETSLKILQMSSTTLDDIENLNKAVSIKFSKEFQLETWNCETCREKRLDGVRNCGYLGEQEKDPTFKIVADNQIYRHCPIYDVDQDILADGVDSYVMYDNKTFPDAGGLYDQTRFFVLASSLITHKVREEENKEAQKEARKQNRQ